MPLWPRSAALDGAKPRIGLVAEACCAAISATDLLLEQTVAELVAERVGTTLTAGILWRSRDSCAIAFPPGRAGGAESATRLGRPVARSVAVSAQAVPNFWLGPDIDASSRRDDADAFPSAGRHHLETFRLPAFVLGCVLGAAGGG